MKFKALGLVAVLLVAALAAGASAAGRPTAFIQKIEVKGNRKVSRSQIVRILGVKPGEGYDPERIRPGVKRLRSQFYLTELGAEAVDELAADPVLKWYVAQSQLVRIVAGTDVGKNLKDRQYKQATYASTELGLSIAPIGDRVRERLNGLAVPTTDTASELLGERP